MSSILLASSRKYPGIPTIDGDVASHTRALEAIRDAIQIHERRTADKLSSFVRLKELVDLGLIRINGNRMELLSIGSGGGSSTLAGLTDVDATGVTDNDVLVYDANYGIWVPQAQAAVLSNWETSLDEAPASPDTMDDEFNSGAFDTGKWTWLNQGGATAVADHTSSSLDHLVLTAPGSAGDNYRIIYQTLPAGNWKFRAKLFGRMTSANFAHTSMIVGRSASSKFYAIGPLYSSGAGMYIQAMNSVSSYSSSPYNLTMGSLGFDQYVYTEIEYDGTNLIFRYILQPNYRQWSPFSFGNPAFTVALTVTPGSFLGGVADQIGFGSDSNNSQTATTYADWFRRIS